MKKILIALLVLSLLAGTSVFFLIHELDYNFAFNESQKPKYELKACNKFGPSVLNPLGDRPLDRFRALLKTCLPSNLTVQYLVHDPDGNDVISMTIPACPMYVLAGASIVNGTAVEMGTWMGGSTRCLAAGANQTGIPGRVFGLDRFDSGLVKSNAAKMVNFATGTRFQEEARRSRGLLLHMAPVFDFYVKTVYPSTVAKVFLIPQHLKDIDIDQIVKGIHKVHVLVNHVAVDFFTTDAAKTWESVVAQLLVMAPLLKEGSIIGLGDFFTSTDGASRLGQVQYVYKYLVPNYLELMSVVPGQAIAFFGLKKMLHELPLPTNLLPSPDLKQKKLWSQIRDRLREDILRVFVPGQTIGKPLEALTDETLEVLFRSWV